MKWYDVKAKSDVSEIWLYGEIGRNFLGEGVDPLEFIAELNAIKSPRIDMHIHSPGGNVFDGGAIFSAIERHPAKVTAYIDGIAGSIASVIALAADEVLISKNSFFMIHNPSGAVRGNANDMRSVADALDKIRETMADTYAKKSGLALADVMAMMDKEAWLKSEEAVEKGFADRIEGQLDLAACADVTPIMAKLGYQNIPTQLMAKASPSERDLERILRDAGCSVKQAKAILAKGYGDALRDVEPAPVAVQATEPPRDVVESTPATSVLPPPRRISERHIRIVH